MSWGMLLGYVVDMLFEVVAVAIPLVVLLYETVPGAIIRLLGRGRDVRLFVPVGTCEYCGVLVVLTLAAGRLDSAGTDAAVMLTGMLDATFTAEIETSGKPDVTLPASEAGKLEG